MNAVTSHKPPIPFNSEMFRWAREWRGRTVEEAAKAAGVKIGKVEQWESGSASPTVTQARRLAASYERQFLEFFLPAPPVAHKPEMVPDFRRAISPSDPRELRELQFVQSWAEGLRANALSLSETIGEFPPVTISNLRASVNDDPEAAAATLREETSFPIEDQFTLASGKRDTLPKILRKEIEALGVMVLKCGDLRKFGARGLCLAFDRLPVILFSKGSPAGQAYTLLHELAHVVLHESAISGVDLRISDMHKRGAKIEKWCDQFAAAFLMPKAAVFEAFPRPRRPYATISDAELDEVASRFRVSRHAMLVRLVHLGYVDADYYWRTKFPQFKKEEDEYEGGGRSPYYGSRYRSANGDLYTGLVIEAWSSGAITNHSAAEFMGIKNIAHLDDIRNRFFDK